MTGRRVGRFLWGEKRCRQECKRGRKSDERKTRKYDGFVSAAQYVVEHYAKIGKDIDVLYAGVAARDGIIQLNQCSFSYLSTFYKVLVDRSAKKNIIFYTIPIFHSDFV